MKQSIGLNGTVACAMLVLAGNTGYAQYQQSLHRKPAGNEIEVSGPGYYARPGATYVLTRDISSSRSTVFLGKDVTLDLNGYTIKYADAGYAHIVNPGFEEGTKGWDLSKAPGAKVVNTAEVHVFVGKKLMSMKAGDIITSSYVNLPLANRSYFAMCGVTGWDYHGELKEDMKNQMQVSIYVEDEQGREVRCVTEYGDGSMVSCPVEKRSPPLGGGVVYAHLNHLPAGKYRVKVKAETDCLVDEIDIRPAMDVGIGIVGRTYPMGHYDHLYNSQFSAFFDYTQDVKEGTPLAGIPVVQGKGTVTIKNGIIENAAVGVLSWGVQSTASEVKVILENVKIKTQGINTIAVDVPQALITHCTFQVENPFIIRRHGSSFYAVDIRGPAPSEVSYSDFYGGQGCLVFKGKRSSIHHNYFVNHQMVTNHYSIMAMGDSSLVFDNRIEPLTGSGIEIYVNKYIEIFNNTIKISTSPPTCEYGHEEYSTNAIRMADYQAKPGAEHGTYGNKVYNNKIYIDAKDQAGVATYVPMSYGIYYSASAGDNDVFGNDIVVNKENLHSKVITAALYICGGTGGMGGNFYNNRITTNVPAAWVASMYGGTANSKIFNNTIIRSPGAADFKPFRMGWIERDDCVAKNVEFRSNELKGLKFGIDASAQDHTYAVYWTLAVHVGRANGKPAAGEEVKIMDKDNAVLTSAKTDASGVLQSELLEYKAEGQSRAFSAPYTVEVAGIKKQVSLTGNTAISFIIN
jgi:hypothetical protein